MSWQKGRVKANQTGHCWVTVLKVHKKPVSVKVKVTGFKTEDGVTSFPLV